MPRRTLWTIFTLLYMLAGSVAGWWLAGSYVIGLNEGHWLWMDLAGKQLTGTPAILAKVAFAVGGLLVGYLVSTLIYAELQRLRRGIETMSAQDKIAVIAGLMVGLILTVLIAVSLRLSTAANLIIAIILCYLSVTVALSMKEHLRLYFPDLAIQGKFRDTSLLRPKILDTNVIIDGRISDICRAGFVEGPIYIPRFVLEELQQIADSGDSLKRARGRRGLDILNQMQKEMSMQIETYEAGNGNWPDEVDAKLVQLAKELGGSIVTNDYNLNKVAALQGIKVLNVNELANALKPVVLPGEVMTVTVVKEGKEQNQGVAYLDDGTMIVVERARRNIGQTLDVVVSSILQTAAGKMIFANPRSEQQEEDTEVERNVRNYTGSRPRRKIR